ncbi:hypothetical protein CD934_27115 [Streptomyces calvus]|uniref:Secreted protein n=1 Tax=Streptomyces calvus TaxID=67282 RepID=A0A514JX16_9ACTN|nr:hypothetical protein [Streptomyces calvus]QDI71947.1 hypothetical protein CD934_27115 [Streptomyces calvus]
MSWTRSLIAVLAVCVVLPAGTAGCGPSDTRERDGSAPSPVGRLLDQRDAEGRPYREVDGPEAPEVGVEVVPDTDGGWDVRLRVRNFRFSPDGTGRRAVAGRGLAHLEVNGRRVARLRTPEYHLPGSLVPRGTHQVTARLYADDGSVWAVDGRPVESTADVTVSEQPPSPDPSAEPLTPPAAAGGGARDRGSAAITGTEGSPDGAEQA